MLFWTLYQTILKFVHPQIRKLSPDALVIIPNEKIIVKLNSCKEFAQRMDHITPK